MEDRSSRHAAVAAMKSQKLLAKARPAVRINHGVFIVGLVGQMYGSIHFLPFPLFSLS
jgi:hypothetical protein